MNKIFSGKYILSFSVTAIVLMAGGTFVWSQMNQGAEPNAQLTPTPSSEPSPTSDPQPIDVPEIPEDWQTYRNEEFGFEMRYPGDLVLLQEDTSTFVSFGKRNPEIIGEGSLNIKILKNVSEKEALGAVRIWTQEDIIQLQRNEPKQFPPDFNAEEFTKTHEYWFFEPVNSYPTPAQEMLIDEKKTLTGEFDVRLGYIDGGYAGLGINTKALISGDGNTYALIYAGFNADSMVLHQILSSFHFLE